MRKKLKTEKIGLIVDDTIVSKQVYDLIQMSKTSEAYDISHLIIQKIEKRSGGLLRQVFLYARRRGVKKLINNFTFNLLKKLESLLVKRVPSFSQFFEVHDLSESGLECIYVTPNLSPSGLVFRYTDESLKAIQDQNLKLLVRCGSGILKGGILTVCPYGVLSFHHGNNNVNRGGPPGFWEVYYREKQTGFVIQRLTEELDGGDVLFRGSIQTRFFYTLNLAWLYEKSNPMLHIVIERTLRNGQEKSHFEKVPYAYPLYSTPSVSVQIRYLCSTMSLMFKKVIKRVLSRGHRWSVAYQFSSSWRDLTLWRSVRISNPPGRFLADPFLIKVSGEYYCFVEDYDFKTARGSISVYSVSKAGYKNLGYALRENFHLSYPFIFTFNEEIYLCPETHETRDIRLYKCEEFPLKWSFYKTLISDISAADSNIFFKDGRWWLVTNVCSSDLDDHSNELHVFYSDDLLNGKWIPHADNPVIFDSNLARNGGLIIEGDDVYRVFQSQDFAMYGRSFGVAKIEKLSESLYEEKILFEIPPHFFKKIEGTHTFNFTGGLAVLDVVETTSIYS